MIDLNTQFTILRANNYIMINQSDVDNIKQTKYETSHCKYLKALRGQKKGKMFFILVNVDGDGNLLLFRYLQIPTPIRIYAT